MAGLAKRALTLDPIVLQRGCSVHTVNVLTFHIPKFLAYANSADADQSDQGLQFPITLF